MVKGMMLYKLLLFLLLCGILSKDSKHFVNLYGEILLFFLSLFNKSFIV